MPEVKELLPSDAVERILLPLHTNWGKIPAADQQSVIKKVEDFLKKVKS